MTRYLMLAMSWLYWARARLNLHTVIGQLREFGLIQMRALVL